MGKNKDYGLSIVRKCLVGVALASISLSAGRVAAQEKVVEKEPVQSKTKDRIHGLKKEKLLLLRDVTSILKSAYMSGSTSLDRVQAAQKAQMAAELELCETDKERFAILKEVFGIARDAEAAADKRFKSGDIPKNELLMATIARIDAEIALEKVRANLEKGDKK